jgi:hypothetical protein
MMPEAEPAIGAALFAADESLTIAFRAAFKQRSQSFRPIQPARPSLFGYV